MEETGEQWSSTEQMEETGDQWSSTELMEETGGMKVVVCVIISLV